MDSDHYRLRDASKKIRLLNLDLATVSHVWGDGKRDCNMRVGSGCGIRHVRMSPNLESSLPQTRDSNTFPHLWEKRPRLLLCVDLICINQLDSGEKALQIPLRGKIHSQASSVIIWINEEDSRVGHAFYCSRYLDANKFGGVSLKYLLNCNWFHRRWLFQERAVPKEAVFLCGSVVMSIDDLFSGIDIAASVLSARPRKIKMLHAIHVGELRKNYGDAEYHVSLLCLLEHFPSTRATVADDQIHSLLGLCSHQEVSGNPVWYDVELDVAYRTFAELHPRLYGNFEFLGLCTAAQRDVLWSGSVDKLICRPFAAPSWVPSWHSERLRRFSSLNDYDADLEFFNASNKIPLSRSFRADGLDVSGIWLDRILGLGDFYHQERLRELFQEYFDFSTTVAAVKRIMPCRDKTHLAETMTRTLSLLGIYLDPVPLPADTPDMFCRWCRGSNFGRQLAELGPRAKDGTNSKGGKMSMGMRHLMPWEPRVGDEIWRVSGCSGLLLLSPQAEDSSLFKVNGEVFLDGFVLAEASKMDELGDTAVQHVT
ncbi:heterokaryon incompatibility domain-containing protein [Trichoderma chlorosporum]